MGIFSSIKEKLFGNSQTASTKTITSEAVKPATADVSAIPATSDEVTATLSGAHSTPAATAGAGHVDIAAILDEAVKKNGQKLDWRHSIVDLMKAVGLDASLAERKELADELGYTGDKVTLPR